MFGDLRGGRRREISGDGGDHKKSDGGKKGENQEFISKKNTTQTQHQLVHQYEGIVIKVERIEPFHRHRAPGSAFGSRCGGGAGRHAVEL